MNLLGTHAPLAADDNRPVVATILRSVLAGWRRFRESVSDPYRPERHYMRGPGPRWRAKHGGRSTELAR
jgi:hypothetical protein